MKQDLLIQGRGCVELREHIRKDSELVAMANSWWHDMCTWNATRKRSRIGTNSVRSLIKLKISRPER